ncbi:MAG TPA: glycosyltransferase family A protein [Solirubrobacterales bacterium]|nr:glycosyltransferase family A protein [Solirubrobacterales bacterium]
MGRLVEVIAVEAEKIAEEGPLRGASVDVPTPGRKMAAAAIEISGWALGQEGPPEGIEVALGDEVLARGVQQERDDLEGAFPEVAGASIAGFAIDVDGSRLPAGSELVVRARVGEETIPLARVGLRRYWRGALTKATPVVSILVVCERDDEGGLERSLKSVARQRHPFTEVLVLRDPSLDKGELRRDGVRRSDGDLLLFLEAGTVLASDALSLGLEMLARAPQAGALLDGDYGEVAAALYRRSALEEDDCDPLFAPGSLLSGGS